MTNRTLDHDYTYFGPTVPGAFDFTLLFEDAFLSLAPSLLLLILIPCRLLLLRRQSQKVAKSSLHATKLQFLIVFAAMQLATLILWTVSSSLKSTATLPAAGLAFVGAIGLCFLSHFEHVRSVTPSELINVYLFLTLPFDCVRSRTLWLDKSTSAIAATFTSTVAIKALILITEAIEKRNILLPPYQHISPEETSGIYSRSLFWWLNNLLRLGFRSVLSNEDLYPLDHLMTSNVLQERSQQTWETASQNKPQALFYSTLWTSKTVLALGVFPRLCLIGFKYSQPFLINRTIEFANSPGESDSIGWGLTGAYALVFAGLAVSNGMYYHMTYRFLVCVRGSLISMIYGKTLNLSITALDESAAVTLMATDTETICNAFQNIHELWAAPIEAALALWLLYRQLGLAFLGSGLIAIFATAGILIVAKHARQAQKIWIQGIQTRIDITASILGHMKSVKMLGFTDLLNNIIQELRVTEMKLFKAYRRVDWIRVLLANSTGLFGPCITFAVFVAVANSSGVKLDTASAYTGLSLIYVLESPMNTMIRTIPMLNSALACFARIQAFLCSDVRRDYRLPLYGRPRSQRNTGASIADIELEELSASQAHLDRPEIAVMRNASFAWAANAEPVVRDVSLTIKRSQFNFIIGPVGAGKSTLLMALLGEVPSTQGFVYTDVTEVAYVDQTPWIQNGTVLENILGISNFERPWYDTVVHACALEDDIAIFPRGHSTPVGSGGISLSGGQKQRVALARAVYSKSPTVILDDIFSGLDANTEEQIFSRLLGNQGLLRSNGKTIVLVTHAAHRLPYAEHIIAMNAHGSVAEQGSFAEIRKAGGYVQDLAREGEAEEKNTEAVAEKGPTSVISPAPLARDGKHRMDELNRKTGDFSVYKYYFATIGWRLNLAFAAGVIVYATGAKLPELLITYWTSAVADKGNEVNSFYLGMYAILTACAIFGFLGAVWVYYMFSIPLSAETLHARLLATVMNAPLAFFTSTDTGQTINRFSQDMNVVDIELPGSLVDLCCSTATIFFSAVLMCVSAGYFAGTVPPVLLILWALQKYYLRTSRQIRLLDLEAKSPLYSHFIESLQGLATIRAFGWEPTFRSQNQTLLDVSQKPYYLLFCIQRWLALVLDLLVTGLAVVLMVLIVKLRADIGAGFVGLALLNVMNFNQSLTTIIKLWTSLETSFGAISRLKSFSAQTASENLPGECQTLPLAWPSHGSIEFKNVSASYLPGSRKILSDFTLSIEAGQKIGVCGRSGSGKSSLLMALFRMLELSPGCAVAVDGVDISTVSRQELRQRIIAIPQEPFFLPGSVGYNADPAHTHDERDIITALQKVKLWDIINEKGGLDANLDYEFFSHGQRQLFCLARAILRRSRIVVLDEATSSVDRASDDLIQAIIRKEFWDCTIIAVAHRLGTILDFDRIALLDEGRLIELDTPDNLLGRNSRFRQLFES